MDSRLHGSRSAISSLAMLVCVTGALAGCKSGGGGSSPAPIAASGSVAPALVPAPVPAPVSAPAPVTPSNSAPKISGTTMASVAANSLYTFKPAASDADGDALAFQIQNKPSWATFNTVTGQLSGTPKVEHAGAFANIVISVTDGKATTAMPAFAIAVIKLDANAASLSWVSPTQNVDGTPLSDLAGFTIVYGTSQAALDQTVRIDNASTSTYALENFPSGTYFFAIKAFTTSGAESALSMIVSKAFD